MKTIRLAQYIIAVSLSLSAIVSAKAPNILNYQGRIQSGGADFTGTGQFKFAIVQSGTVVWGNAADGNADGQPDTAVSVTVTSGLFNVGLGDTALTNMAALTLATPFDTTATQPFTLRLWFNDGVKGFQQLAPDQALQSVPFSRVAATVDDGGITSAKLATGAVTAAKLGTGSVTAVKIAAGAVSGLGSPNGSLPDVVAVNNAGLVSLGEPDTNLVRASEGALTLGVSDAGMNILFPLGSFGSGTFTSGEVSNGITAAFDGASDVAVSGTNVFLVSEIDDSFAIINNTDPAAPVILSQLVNGVGGITSLNGPHGVAVAGNFAFVASANSLSFTIIDVSNPAAPVVSAVRTDGAGGFNDLAGATDVAVSANGNTAFVAATGDDAVSIINTSTKTNPTLTSVIKNGVNGVVLTDPRQVIVSGNRLYVSTATDIVIFNVSSLASPTVFATVPASANPVIALNGNTLYWSNSSTMEVWDVTTSTPARLTQKTLADFGGNFSINSMAIEGTNLWASTVGGALVPRVVVFDITTPAAPVLTHMSVSAGLPGSFVNEMFLTSPAAVAAFSANRAVVVNAAPGAFVTMGRNGGSIANGTSLATEGNVGIRVSHPQMPLHVAGNGLFENGSLVIGSGGLSVFTTGSLACGKDNVVVGDNNAALGEGLVTALSGTGFGSVVVVGSYNTPPASNVRFAVGNGSLGARSTALTVLSNGNIGLNGVPVPANPLEHSSGARLTSGGTWTNASDRNLKENLKPADEPAVLEKISRLPVYEWNYKAEPGVTHMGPMAQDFRAAFALGADEKSISTVDEGGVTLAAIKALIEENRALRQRVEALEKKVQAP